MDVKGKTKENVAARRDLKLYVGREKESKIIKEHIMLWTRIKRKSYVSGWRNFKSPMVMFLIWGGVFI